MIGLGLDLGRHDLDAALLELGPERSSLVLAEVVLQRECLESALFDCPPLLDLVE